MKKQSKKHPASARQITLTAYLPVEEDVELQVANALNPDYWQRLNPGLSVGKDSMRRRGITTTLKTNSHESLLRQLAEDGYFQTPVLLPKSLVHRMREGVQAVRKEGWPGAFAFLYDEFWTVFRAPALAQLLAAHLGGEYRQLPDVWAHHVGPNSSGWPPHVDGGSRRGRRKITVWLPLTDATLNNGCIYVVRCNQKTDALARNFMNRGRYRYAELVTLMQNSKALPAPAGAFLAWGPELIHWGSTSINTAHPRISLAVEFTSDLEFSPVKGLPLIETGPSLPSFATRLLVLAHAIPHYERFDPALGRRREFAERIISSIKTAEL